VNAGDFWALLPQDGAFYAVAIPAALMLGLAKSGFGSGFGSLATPLLALVMPVPQAAALMLSWGSSAQKSPAFTRWRRPPP
jgi:uncharacterized membrane protein YfcA